MLGENSQLEQEVDRHRDHPHFVVSRSLGGSRIDFVADGALPAMCWRALPLLC